MRRTLTVMTMVIALAMGTLAPAVAEEHCQPAGDTGLDANYVNDTPTEPLEVTCDIGIFVDEDAAVDGVDLEGTVDGSRSTQYGVYVAGADVDVTDSSVDVAEDFPGQFLSVAYRDGASGTISGNDLTGAHRTAVLLRGDGTDVAVSNNTIDGTGAKTSGWAENGIQVDQQATADISGNAIRGHWWDGESNFASAGIMLFGGDGSQVTNNTLVDNEFSVYLGSDDNHLSGNDTSSSIDSERFQAYGVLIDGDGNHLAGNRFSADDGAVGIYVLSGTANRLTGNRTDGFDTGVVDSGDDTAEHGNPSPASG